MYQRSLTRQSCQWQNTCIIISLYDIYKWLDFYIYEIFFEKNLAKRLGYDIFNLEYKFDMKNRYLFLWHLFLEKVVVQFDLL